MKKLLSAGMLTLAILINTSLLADEITDQINESLKAYKEKDYKVAIDELTFVTAQLQKLNAAENQKLLPKPLEGWTAGKADNSGQAALSMLGGMTSMKARYLKKVSKRKTEQVDIEVMANSPLIAMMSMAINNPAMMASDASTEPYRYKRIKGMKKVNGNNTEITLLIAGQILLKINGTQLKDSAVLEQYLDAIDISKLKEKLL